MSSAADGQDRKGLYFEKNWAAVFNFIEKRANTLIIVYFSFEHSLDIYLLVFYKYFVYDKVS